jgi:hypothetical protein
VPTRSGFPAASSTTVTLVVLPEIAGRIRNAVEVEGVEEPVLEDDPIAGPGGRAVRGRRAAAGSIRGGVAVESRGAVDRPAEALVVVPADEVRVGQEAVHGLGPEALVRVENEPRSILPQELRRLRPGRRGRGGRERESREREPDDGHSMQRRGCS